MIKPLYALLSSLFLILISGCSIEDDKVEVISAEPSDYKIHLYNHLEDHEQANNYLAALLNWKMKQKDEDALSFKESTVRIKDINLNKDDLPALVITKNGKPVEIISGKHSNKEDILHAIERTVSLPQNKNS
ncbi:hypothetical protein [Halobacillus sp. Marseille-Q1614]|uniref:hypothetical protein n=1 Tax=Halobacillus sp. Marseille-Q1614 TaxID=2709134 RepID=UPI001570B924|nr:hypothetical protein [Halobacillus sp. Marseille-Q1614]